MAVSKKKEPKLRHHYPAYNFKADPALDAAKAAIQDSGMTFKEIYEAGGATVATQKKWWERGWEGTCRFNTLMATVRAAGGDIVFRSPKGHEIKVITTRKK